MRLGIDAHKFARAHPTGTERYSSEIITHLIKTAQKSDEITLYSAQTLGRELAKHTSVRVLPHLPPILPFTYATLPLELRRHPVERLFVPAHELPPTRIPTLVAVHDVAFRKYPHAYSLWQRLRLEYSTRRAVRSAWRIITISEATKRDLVDLFGARPEQVRVVYPGFSAPAKRSSDPAALRTLRVEAGRYLLYIGRIESKKNLERIVGAFNAARKSGELTWRLVLAGTPGADAERVDAQIRRFGLESEVVRPGYVSEELKQTLLIHAGAVVVPSLYEGFGFPLLEAFAAEVPVLASSGGSIPEVAGEAAIICPPIDTEAFKRGMIQLERDPSLRAELVRKGRERLKKFNWTHSAKELWKIIKEPL